MVNRVKASRDYFDWLGPYIEDKSFTDPTYYRFWLEDVLTERVPRNRLTGLVAYYQEYHKITHGNFADQIHACYLLDVDIFITADRAFNDILLETALQFPGSARPVLIDRAASSALEEIRLALQ